MTSYQLQNLNDKEFEVLGIEIIESILKVRIERFKPGKDKGVDGRFFIDDGKEVIIQAKHWQGSGFARLIKHLVKSELPKIRSLSPARYLLVTSVPLSRLDKKKIKSALHPFILAENDILGNEDIQSILGKNPQVVERNYKLWLAGSEVLRIILNAPIIGRSNFKREEALEFLPKYVPTSCHQRALELLNQRGSIIIIGEPGIGKTTLADQVAIDYIARGAELCVIESSLSEAEAVWDPNKKQLFYFDDFLGRNYLEAIGRTQDSHVLSFIRRVERDKKKRFVLTSRTTILNQGKRLSEHFRAQNLDRSEFEIRVTDLSLIEKARILYNHIWFGSLEPSYVEALYINKRYRTVIAHKNFNPRLIAFITDSHKIAGISCEDYWEYVLRTLDNPADIWNGVYENQLDEVGRALVTLVVMAGGSVLENELRLACSRMLKQLGKSSSEWNLAFEKSYQLCVGALLNRTIKGDGFNCEVGLFNPSVGDFVIRKHKDDVDTISDAIKSLRSVRSIEVLSSMRKNNIISHNAYFYVFRCLAKRFLVYGVEDVDFSLAIAACILKDNCLLRECNIEIENWANDILDRVDDVSNHADMREAVVWFIQNEIVSGADPRLPNVASEILQAARDEEDMALVSELVASISGDERDRIEKEYKESVIAYWKENLGDLLNERDIALDYRDPEREFYRAKHDIEGFVMNSLSETNIEFSPLEIDEIVESYDVFEHIVSNSEGYDTREPEGPQVGGGDNFADVDDLFDRTI